MKIRSISVDGIGGLPDRRFDFLDPRTGVARSEVVITGPMASGKTRLLDAIAFAKEDIAPYGTRPDPSDILRDGAKAAKIAVTWEIGGDDGRAPVVVESESIFGEGIRPCLDHDPDLADCLGAFDLDPARGKVEYFPDSRELRMGFGSGLRAADQRRVRMSRDRAKYAAIPRFLSELGLGLFGDDALASFRARLALVLPATRFLGSVRRDDRIRAEFSGPDGARDLGKLSRGESTAVLFAAVATLLGLDRSLVLIDTPELYTPADRAAELFRALGKLGTDNQIIVATSSREILDSVAPGTVVHLDSARGKGE